MYNIFSDNIALCYIYKLAFYLQESSEDNPNYKDLIAALGRISYCGEHQ